MNNLDSILKSRDITLPTKVHLVKAMVFPVVMYGCGNWTVKKAEHRRTDAFEVWCWRRLLRVPWTARRSNQSILKEISPGISLEGMMLKLKLQNPSRAPAVFVGRVVARSQEVAQRASALCPATASTERDQDEHRGEFSKRTDLKMLFLQHASFLLHRASFPPELLETSAQS